MPRLAEAVLDSFFDAAEAEFEDVAKRQPNVDCRLRFGDRLVRLRCAGRELAEALLPAFAGGSGDGGDNVVATISVWEERVCVGGSVRFPWGEGDIGPGGLVRGSGGRVAAVHDTYWGALTLADLDERSLLYRVPNAEAVPWWERAAPLRSALFWALGGGRRHLVQAGAVGDDRGAALLAGASGSGKTTVALAALMHGFGYLADDYVLLDVERRPTAHSIYNKVSVVGSGQAGQKAVLDVSALMPGSLRATLPVRAVIVPRIRGGRAQLRAISAGEAMRAWAPATALQMPLDGGAVVASLARVVRAVPCFALDVGDEEAQLAGAVERVLVRVCS
jgi:hypothetical protein